MDLENICQRLNISLDYAVVDSSNTFTCKVSKTWVNEFVSQLDDDGICKSMHLKFQTTELNPEINIIVHLVEINKMPDSNKTVLSSSFCNSWDQKIEYKHEQQLTHCIEQYNDCSGLAFLFNRIQRKNGLHDFQTVQSSSPLIGKVENGSTQLLIYQDITHSVQNALVYSSSLIKCTILHIKPMFLIYQVLQSMSSANNLYKVNYTWDNIKIDEKCWLYIPLKQSDQTTSSFNSRSQSDNKEFDDNNPSSLTQKWICGKISNLDYLLHINKLAGREMGNPSNHPILPWVSNLLSQTNSWRDLTKSKYRLNKGDNQLDLQYTLTKELQESKDGSSKDIPHHIPEFLSDITYYVYKSRQTDKDILCKLVRSYWEPNEYPASIQRMQEWTPEECIPEFYTDSSIFYSIHEDMLDLAVPKWAESAEDFIAKHREMLESDEVSKELHHWIDLTFGHKLSGKDALKSKNVCLAMVDQHVELRNQGINQIFQYPHPRKFAYKSPQVNSIYNVVEGLDFMEQNSKFYLSTAASGNKNSVLAEYCQKMRSDAWKYCTENQSIAKHNVACFTCLCFELFLIPYMRSCAVDDKNDVQGRLLSCINCFNANKSKLSKSIVLFLEKLTQIQSTNENSLTDSSGVFDDIPISNFNEIISFPAYFTDLYEKQTNNFISPLKDVGHLKKMITDLLSNVQESTDCLKILMPHILALLDQNCNLDSSVLILTSLFEPIANSLNCENTNKWFLKPVLKIYNDAITRIDSKTESTSTITLLISESFLTQLILRFGCQVYLENFPRFLCEGLVNFTDEKVVYQANESLSWLMKKFGPTSTSKYIIPFLFRAVEACFAEKCSADYGDLKSMNILTNFITASEVYGPQMMLVQFLPHIYHRISFAISSKVTNLSALEGNISALISFIPYLSDASIMGMINHLHSKVLIPVLQYLTIDETNSASTSTNRKQFFIISTKFVKLLSILAYRVGREMALQHFSDIIKEYIVSMLLSVEQEAIQENHENPTQAIICMLYLDLYKLLGRQLDAMLGNEMESVIEILPHNKTMTKAVSLPRVANAKSVVVGNKIVVSNSTTSLKYHEEGDFSTTTNTYSDINIRKELLAEESTQLSDNWLAYWGHEIGLAETDKHIHFNQIDLGHFQSHNSAIRSLYVHPNEDWFASAGRDKLVKLWSLETSSGCNNENFCYSYHKKSVNHIGVLNYNFQMVTSDSSQLHLWDPFTGNQLRTVDASDLGASISSVSTTQLSQPLCIAATSDNVLHLIDGRVKSCLHRYRSTSGASVGIVRCICVGGDWISIGFSSGVVSLLDIRVGSLISLRQCHDSDIITSHAVNTAQFLTASADQSVALWEVGTNAPLRVYKSFNETVHVVKTFNNEIIAGTASNRIFVNQLSQNDKAVVETKLRSDIMKGVLTTLCVLPIKRQLLLASDTGAIKLLA